MINNLRRTLNPAWYQGRGRSAPYFEGWYFKLVDPTERYAVAVIPGIFRAVDPVDSHAFIQILDGGSGQATYHAYPLDVFHAARGSFDIRIGESRFTLDRMTLDVGSPHRSLNGQVDFVGRTPWPVRPTSPGVMGWFAWIPFLQTYHGVLSLDHTTHGSLSLDDEIIDFGGGRGYIEKDWGSSFPDAWVWIQTNHFDTSGTSLTASIATIPWLGSSFRGFIIGLWHAEKLYRFTTYTGARIEELTLRDGEAAVVVADRRYRLEFTARGASTGVLRGPTGLDMAGRVPESLDAEVTAQLSLTASAPAPPIFEGIGRRAGLEIVGDHDQLLV